MIYSALMYCLLHSQFYEHFGENRVVPSWPSINDILGIGTCLWYFRILSLISVVYIIGINLVGSIVRLFNAVRIERPTLTLITNLRNNLQN